MKLSNLTNNLKQPLIRAMSAECSKIGGINLGQGVCDLPIISNIKVSAIKSILDDKSTYAEHQGISELREAISNKAKNYNKIINQDKDNVLISHGSTGAYLSCCLALFNKGDNVILFEPFYGYHKTILEMYGVNVKTINIDIKNNFSINLNDIKNIIDKNTKGIVICTPNNPSGKVFSKKELEDIGLIAEQNNLFIITDEIYEYVVYDENSHYSLASNPRFFDRTITLSGMSKTYNMTGWRLGYAIANKKLIEKMAIIHDIHYVCPSTPLQYAAITALEESKEYYQNICNHYNENKKLVCSRLKKMGFEFTVPEGSYYLIIDYKKILGNLDDIDISYRFLREAKVSLIPARCFYNNQNISTTSLRLCYAKDRNKLEQALNQIEYFLHSLNK